MLKKHLNWKEHALKKIESKPLNQITLPTLRGPVESGFHKIFVKKFIMLVLKV